MPLRKVNDEIVAQGKAPRQPPRRTDGVMAASSTHVRTGIFPSASSRSATAPPMDTPYSPQSAPMPRCASQPLTSTAMSSTLV